MLGNPVDQSLSDKEMKQHWIICFFQDMYALFNIYVSFASFAGKKYDFVALQDQPETGLGSQSCSAGWQC